MSPLPSIPESQSPNRPRPILLAIGTFALFTLIGTTIVMLSESKAFLTFVLQRLTNQLKHSGVLVELHNVTPREVEFSLESKVPKIDLNHAKARLQWHYFLPAIEISLDTPIEEFGLEYLDLEDIRLNLRGLFGLFRYPELQVELHAKTYEFLHQKSPYPISMNLTYQDENLVLLLASEGKHLTNKLQAQGRIALSPFLLDVQINGTWGDLQMRGPLRISENNGNWQGQATPSMLWNNTISFEPVLNYHIGETASGKLIIPAATLKSNEVKLNRDLELEWTDSAQKDTFTLTCPRPCLSFTFSDTTINTGQWKLVADKSHASSNWRIDSLIDGIASPSLHQNFLDLKTKELTLRSKGYTLDTSDTLFKLEGEISEQHTDLVLPFKLLSTKSNETIRVDFSSRLSLSGKYQPSMFLSRFRGKLYLLAGGAEIKSSLWFPKKEPIHWDFKFSLNHLEGLWRETPFRRVDFNTHLQLYPKFRSITPLTLSIDQFGKDLVIEDLRMKLGVIDEAHLELIQLDAKISGGTLGVAPFGMSLTDQDILTQFRLENLDLRLLLKALAPDKLQGEGKLTGEGTVGLEKGELIIPNAKLVNIGKGIVRYGQIEPAAPVKKIEYLDQFQALLEEGHQALVFKALENFHYDILTLEATRSTTVKLGVNLHLKGRNPDLAKGQVFEINLPVSGQLESLILNSVLQSSVEEEIDKHQY